MFVISKDKTYMLIGETVLDLRTGFRYDKGNMHPAIVCELFKTQFVHAHKHGLMENTDLFRKMKTVLYPLLQVSKDLVMEYEVRYGMRVLSENEGPSFSSIRLIEESWEFTKMKMLDIFPVTKEELMEDWELPSWNDVKRFASNAYDSTVDAISDVGTAIKDTAVKAWDTTVDAVSDAYEWTKEQISAAVSWIINKGLPWFFEKLEAFLLNPITMGVEIALSAVGVGKVAGAILWGALGVWKIYQLFSGKIENDWWAYLDIGICLIGAIATGAAAKALNGVIKGAGRTAKGLQKVLNSSAIKPLVDIVKYGATKVLGFLSKAFDWLGKAIGSKSGGLISKVKSSIDSMLSKLKSLFEGAGQTIAKSASKAGPVLTTEPLRAAAKAGKLPGVAVKGARNAAAIYGAEDLLKKGIYKWYGTSEEQVKNMETLKNMEYNYNAEPPTRAELEARGVRMEPQLSDDELDSIINSMED